MTSYNCSIYVPIISKPTVFGLVDDCVRKLMQCYFAPFFLKYEHEAYEVTLYTKFRLNFSGRLPAKRAYK